MAPAARGNVAALAQLDANFKVAWQAIIDGVTEQRAERGKVYAVRVRPIHPHAAVAIDP